MDKPKKTASRPDLFFLALKTQREDLHRCKDTLQVSK